MGNITTTLFWIRLLEYVFRLLQSFLSMCYLPFVCYLTFFVVVIIINEIPEGKFFQSKPCTKNGFLGLITSHDSVYWTDSPERLVRTNRFTERWRWFPTIMLVCCSLQTWSRRVRSVSWSQTGMFQGMWGWMKTVNPQQTRTGGHWTGTSGAGRGRLSLVFRWMLTSCVPFNHMCQN